jgi:hypothetical protein
MTPAAEKGISVKTSSAFKQEPSDLQKLIVDAVGNADPGVEGFIAHRFWRPFRYSITAAQRYGFAFSALTVLVIGAGLASSVLAAAPGHHNDTIVAVLGIVVAVAAAINRLWRPGLRAVVRSRTANALRREGWAFACSRGDYAKMSSNERLGAFLDEVQKINAVAEVVDEADVEPETKGGG